MNVEPLPDGALDRHLAAHGLDHVLDDRQTEAGPTELARATRVDAVEALEDARQVLGGDARAGVGHDEPDTRPRPPRRSRRCGCPTGNT